MMKLDLVPQDIAHGLVIDMLDNTGTYPIKTAEGFRYAALEGLIAINPMLNIDNEGAIAFLVEVIRGAIREGRMIDFGFIPNEVLKQTSTRTRAAYEAAELCHPYDNWLAVSAWEGGYCGYYFSPAPDMPGQIIGVEIYGIALPGITPALLVNDVIAMEVTNDDNKIDTVIRPINLLGNARETHQDIQDRGANVLDPLVTFLRILSDASIPIVDKPAPDRLNKQRLKHGKPAIPAYTQVQTKDYVAAFRGAMAGRSNDRGGHHASPVAHWRRSHQRHLSTGKVVPVRSSKVNWRDAAELHRLFYRV